MKGIKESQWKEDPERVITYPMPTNEQIKGTWRQLKVTLKHITYIIYIVIHCNYM